MNQPKGHLLMAKRSQLVTQYLENVSSKAFDKYQDIIRSYVARRQGIYALYKRDKLYYVGLATNLRTRLRQHLRDRHAGKWDRFSAYLTLDSSQLKELESLALRIVMPKGNKQMGKFHKAENLLHKFRKDIRLSLDRELSGVVVSVRKDLKKRPNKIVQEASKWTGRVPVLARYVAEQLQIRTKYKGKNIRALVLKDGSIRLKGKYYNSPSIAGRAVVNRACDGWHFWKYMRGPGDWVKLDELRK
jgi:predicted GIY-YIG superfamily endonuclease